MNFLYKSLFRLRASGIFSDGQLVDYLDFRPTAGCQSLLSKYRLLSRNGPLGIDIYYDSDPAPAPRWPITQEETFYFVIQVKSNDILFYVDTRDWSAGKVFLLKNPVYNTTSNVTIDFTTAESGPFRFFPMAFKYTVALQNKAGLLRVTDSAGKMLKEYVVRPASATESLNTQIEIDIDLSEKKEGTYTIQYLGAGAMGQETVICSPDFTQNAFAIVQVNYKTGIWTGQNEDQRYEITLGGRVMNWSYEIHLRPRKIAIDPTTLIIEHQPSGEPLVTMNIDNASITAAKDFVRFNSAAPIPQRIKPIRLQLKDGTTTFVDPMPLPTQNELILNGAVLQANMFVTI